MKNSKVSVVMAVYNGERYLAESIESILNQTFSDFEFLIINDGSTDKSMEVVASYNDPRIRLIDNSSNIGLTYSLNKGIAMSRAPFIARMDADDISDPERFQRQVEEFEKAPDLGLLGTSCLIIDDTGKIIRKARMPSDDLTIRWSMLAENAFAHSSVMMRKKFLTNSTPYNINLSVAQDFDLWSRLLVKCKGGNLNSFLHRYRTGGLSFTQRVNQIAVRRLVTERNIRLYWPDLSEDNIELISEALRTFSHQKFDSHKLGFTILKLLKRFVSYHQVSASNPFLLNECKRWIQNTECYTSLKIKYFVKTYCLYLLVWAYLAKLKN